MSWRLFPKETPDKTAREKQDRHGYTFLYLGQGRSLLTDVVFPKKINDN